MLCLSLRLFRSILSPTGDVKKCCANTRVLLRVGGRIETLFKALYKKKRNTRFRTVFF